MIRGLKVLLAAMQLMTFACAVKGDDDISNLPSRRGLSIIENSNNKHEVIVDDLDNLSMYENTGAKEEDVSSILDYLDGIV